MVENYLIKKAVEKAIKGNGKDAEVVRAGVVILDVQILSSGDLQESLRSYGLDAANIQAALETATATVRTQIAKSASRIVVPKLVPKPNG